MNRTSHWPKSPPDKPADPFRANRQIQSALKALAELMCDPRGRPDRKSR
jgi:hypothetical protein